jgi:hypothetical protein
VNVPGVPISAIYAKRKTTSNLIFYFTFPHHATGGVPIGAGMCVQMAEFSVITNLHLLMKAHRGFLQLDENIPDVTDGFFRYL